MWGGGSDAARLDLDRILQQFGEHGAFGQEGMDGEGGYDVLERQVVSALLKHGPNYLADTLRVFRQWMEEHEYASLDVLRGSMNVARCPEPAMYARSHYIQTLQTWK